ncbi:MAG: hypothetical protein ABW168_21940, partial [Sedimenticola sp.]
TERYRLKSDQNATKLPVIYFVRLKQDGRWLIKSIGYNWQPTFAPIDQDTHQKHTPEHTPGHPSKMTGILVFVRGYGDNRATQISS